MMTQSEELGIQCVYFTAEAVILKEGFPPWALINLETDRNVSLIIALHPQLTEILNWRLLYRFSTHPAFSMD